MAYSASNYHSKIGTEFAKQVTEATEEKLIITVHAGGSLFKGDQIFSAVQRGVVPIGERLISALSNEDPLFGLDSIPFLATSFEEAYTLYQLSKPILEAKLESQGLKFLYSVPWPPQGFYSVRSASSKDDLEGLKFRAYNSITSRLAELLGMLPTKIEASELSQAFATRVAESMISSGSTGYDRKLWEHVDYFYDVRAWLPRNMVVVNREAWDDLSKKQQKIITEAASEAERKGWASAEELADWYVAQFRKKGMRVAVASPSLVNDFITAGKRIRSEWLEQAGPEGRTLIDTYLRKSGQ